MGVSEQTIKNHVSAALRKLNANDRAHAVMLAVRTGLVSVQPDHSGDRRHEKRLFAACSGKTALDVRNRAVLSIFLDTGLRANELANLTLDDVDMHSGSVLVRHGKGGKQRVVHR